MIRASQIKVSKQKQENQPLLRDIEDNINQSTPRKRFPTIAGQLTVPSSTRKNGLLRQLNIEQVSEDHSRRSLQQQSKSIIEPLYSPKNDPNLYTVEQIEIHKKMIQNMWDYRYWRLIEYAIRTKDWMPVFAFIGQFKLKCVQLIKKLVSCKFQQKQIDRIDHRYQLKGQNQIGIYLIDGIIIRVAKIRKNKKQFDKRAQKNLHQQFISYNIVNDLIISLCSQMPNFPTLRVPVTCLVKYMGCTFLCQGDTMCNGIQTLIYGPMSSTFKFQQNIAQLLHMIGRNLNLKSFNVMTANKNILQIPFCLTVELHKVNIAFRDMSIISWFNPQSRFFPNHQKQNKLVKPQYYLLSFAKLWPLFIDSNIVSSSGYLRPQAVLAWKKQLSNSVFTNIGFQKDQLGQLQLAQACKSVKQQCIKQLANFLDEASFFVVDSVSIQEIMHYYKINLKFLGHVTTKISLELNKKIFQVEMTARILKKLFYTNIQGLQQKQSIKQMAADFLNLVFLITQLSERFYLKVVYPNIQKYYDYKITQYPPNFSGGGLMHALCFHLGLKIKVMDYPLFKKMDSFFVVSHILDFVPYARAFNLDTCELKKSCEKFKLKKKQGKQNLMSQCINQLKLLAVISKISSPQGTYSTSSSPQSYFYAQLAEVYRNLNDYDECYKYAELSVKGIPDKHADSIKAYCTFIRYHGSKKQINKCYEYYEKALANITYHLHQNHPLSISVHNTLGFQLLNSNADSSKCEKTFQKSFEVCQQALGYMHSTSGKILLQLADLPLPPQKTIHFLLQALTILQNIETDKQKVRNVCKKISEMYAKMNNLAKMIQFARKSEHWTNQIIALQKLNQYKMVLQLCSRPANNVQQLQFLIQKSFSSYIKLLDFSSSSNLYKLFVVLVNHLPNSNDANQRIYKKLTTQFSISMTIVQFVKTTLNNLLAQIPQLLKQVDYRIGPTFFNEYKDRKLKLWVENYMDILAIVGSDKCENVFTQFKKRF